MLGGLQGTCVLNEKEQEVRNGMKRSAKAVNEYDSQLIGDARTDHFKATSQSAKTGEVAGRRGRERGKSG